MTQLDWGIILILCVAIGGLIGLLWRMAKKEQEQWRFNQAINARRWKEEGKEFLWIMLLLGLAAPLPAQAVNYDIVYVRVPRYGDGSQPGDRIPFMAEIGHPLNIEPGTELMLLHPDGSEELLVTAGPDGGIIDPSVSLDGKWIYYVQCPNVRNRRHFNLPHAGCDIWKISLQTRNTIQLTFQEWTPPEGTRTWCTVPNPTGNEPCLSLGYGVYNLGPSEISPGRIVFTSSRDSFVPIGQYTKTNQQLFVLDQSTGITEKIGFLNVGSALHPIPLSNGSILFSSYETQGRRDNRLWGLWTIYPDGRHWAPSLSAFLREFAVHFHAELTDGSIVATNYYNFSNYALGALLIYGQQPITIGRPMFGSPNSENATNPLLAGGCSDNQTRIFGNYPFSPLGLLNLTPFTSTADHATKCLFPSGERMGKAGYPKALPGNGLLLSYASGPVNNLQRPTNKPFPKIGIYYIADGRTPIIDPSMQLTMLKSDEHYNAIQAAPVVTYSAIYGKDAPTALPYLPRMDSRLLPGEAAGFVGTSSLCKHDADAENKNSNWLWQGSSIGKGRYTCDDIYAIRLLALSGVSTRYRGPNSYAFGQGAGFEQKVKEERHRILGEIVVRKNDGTGTPILDTEGNPDTSFLVKIPADIPFTFQAIDKEGRPLNHSATWHQLRSGEKRNDCGGCHAHSQLPLDFQSTAAANPVYAISDLTKTTPLLNVGGSTTVHAGISLTYEFTKDIVPILTRLGMQTDYLQASATSQAYNAHDSGMYAAAQAAGGTPDELLTIARWIAVGLPKDSGDWELDEMRPALAMELNGGMLWIGANDDHAGVEIESLTVTVDGQPVTPRYVGNNRWAMPFTSPGRVRATVDDNQGNRTVLERVVTLQPPVILTPQQIITQARGLLLNLGNDTEASCEGVEALRVLLSENEAVCQ